MSLDDIMIENLPIVLVSSVDTKAADSVITEIIEDKETPSEDSSASDAGAGREWRLANKYYTARVRLLPATDPPAPAALALAPEAHIIYLTEAECECGAAAAALLERRAAAGGAAAVRLALADCAAEPRALAAAAARRRYELLALREPAEGGDAEGERGWGRARAALHAHTWPGLRRAARAGGRAAAEAEADEEAGAVERAELFAEALAALAATRSRPADERRARADALLGAFARALGLPGDLDL